MKRSRLLAVCLALLLPLGTSSCLENEEVIRVRADGSVDVRVRAKGDLPDLLDGHPLSLGGPWRPASRDAERFLQLFGPATGGRAAQQRLPASAPIWADGDKEQLKGELIAEAHFARVEDWPVHFAPAGEPYADALPARRSQLEIRRQGARTVYVFERRFEGRQRARLGFFQGVEELAESDRPLWQLIEARAELNSAQWKHLNAIARRSAVRAAEGHVRAALATLYVEGDASLDPADLPQVLSRVEERVTAIASPSRLRKLYEWLKVAEDVEEKRWIGLIEGKGDSQRTNAMARLLEDLREGVRESLDAALTEAGMGQPARNAIAYALEWGFAADDAISDLGDERFEVRLQLPGTLVGGNFERTDAEGMAFWKFDGEQLQEGDVVLRAVSVR